MLFLRVVVQRAHVFKCSVGVRNRAARAWALERQVILSGGRTSVEWTAEESAAIVAGRTPSGWIGHHINSVAGNSVEMAEDPRNIEFVKGRAAHLAKHSGSWVNKTEGELIDRLANLGGAGLALFLTVFEEKVHQYTKDCQVCSDPDSKMAYINPTNNAIENLAAFEALLAVENDRKRRARESTTDAERQCVLGNPAACGAQ